MVGRNNSADEDIMMMSLDGAEPRVEPLIATRAEEYAPRVSPDGKWLAYISTAAGQPQLYIRRFPDGVDLPVSRDFAQGPAWSPDSSELYFQGAHEGAVKMLAVKITGAPGATPDCPTSSHCSHCAQRRARTASTPTALAPTANRVSACCRTDDS